MPMGFPVWRISSWTRIAVSSWWRHQMETFSAWQALCVGQWHGALMFSFICARTNGWVNNRDACDVRCHVAHYDVTVMLLTIASNTVSNNCYFPQGANNPNWTTSAPNAVKHISYKIFFNKMFEIETCIYKRVTPLWRNNTSLIFIWISYSTLLHIRPSYYLAVADLVLLISVVELISWKIVKLFLGEMIWNILTKIA